MKTKCIIIDDEPIAREIICDHISKIDDLELIAEFKKPTEALSFLNTNRVDLIFLDINLPEINGIEFARSLVNPPSVIFTTAYREYAPEGFEIHAIDFLVKPISFERFLKAINHYLRISTPMASQSFSENPDKFDENFVFLKDSKKTHKVFLKDIKYIESDGDYLKFYIHDKRVMIRGSLASWEITLPASRFIRIHNSYLVSIRKIVAITPYSVEIDGVELPVSRSHKERVMKVLNVRP